MASSAPSSPGVGGSPRSLEAAETACLNEEPWKPYLRRGMDAAAAYGGRGKGGEQEDDDDDDGEEEEERLRIDAGRA